MQVPRSHFPLRLDNLSREGLKNYFLAGWQLDETMFASLVDDAVYVQPDPLRHPLIFYFGHSAAFFINKLRRAGLRACGLDDHLDDLLARGVDPQQSSDLGRFVWPTAAEVTDYRDRVHAIIIAFIETLDAPLSAVDEDHPLWALIMGLEHQRIHVETSSVLIRQLPIQAVRRPGEWTYADPQGNPLSPHQWIQIDSGVAELGRPRSAPQYYWDNEIGSLDVPTPAFDVRSHMVTNAEFFEFWRDNGYGRRDLWSDRGWAWREEHEVSHPRFWIDCDTTPRYRAMFDILDLPPHWPAEVNAHEAQAFCRWHGDGARLMSEAEYTLAVADAPLVHGDCNRHCGYNLNFCHISPRAVGSVASAITPSGLSDPYGNVWQWLSNEFYPLPGFAVHPYYQDFSKPYFDRDHLMLKGGSWASTGTGASRWYRLWFRHHFYQHAGFRLARSRS